MNIRQLARRAMIEFTSPFLKPKNGVYILNGHSIQSRGHLESNKFISQLKKLKNNYDFINFNDALNMIFEGESTLINERLIAFTFDDGFSDCFTHIAPILNRFDVNACFFINSAFIDSDSDFQKYFTLDRVNSPGKKPMTWMQIKELDENGFVIGNHTKEHLRLSELNDNDFYYQVNSSHNEIEKVLGKRCEYFAWPYGSLNDINKFQVIALKKKYKYIFSSANYDKYFSFDGDVVNRRHFEPFWPASHTHYFLGKGKKY